MLPSFEMTKKYNHLQMSLQRQHFLQKHACTPQEKNQGEITFCITGKNEVIKEAYTKDWWEGTNRKIWAQGGLQREIQMSPGDSGT